MMMLRGLGATLGRSLGQFGQFVNPATKAGGGAHVPPATDSSGSPSYYVEPRGPHGYTSFGISTLWINYLTKLGDRIQGVTNEIRATGLVSTPYPANSWVGCAYQAKTHHEDVLTPTGIIMLFGTPFPVGDLEAGGLSKGFDSQWIPNAEQRFLLDYAIYLKSQAILAALMDGRGCGKNVDVAIDSSYGAWSEKNPIQRLIAPLFGKARGSVRAYTEACDEPHNRLTTWIDGYSMNPIQPTDDELNNEGGLQRYYERGGFLLSKRITNGAVKLDNTGKVGLHWPIGYYVCGDRPVPALFYHTGEGDGWDIFVELDGLGGYGLRVQPNSQETGQKILAGISEIMKKIRELLCTVAPFAAPIATSKLNAEICVDRTTGQNCAKNSSATCKCTPPTTAQKDAVAMSQAILSHICSMGPSDEPVAPPTPDQISPPPTPPLEPWRPKWWMIALAGLGIGGAAALSLRR